MIEPILRVDNLKKYYPVKKTGKISGHDLLKAVDGISFEIMEGETLALVGESGCGKSTARKVLLRMEEATSGQVFFKGDNIYKMDRKQLRDFRRSAQVIFQDPYSSLDPKWKVENIITEPLTIHKIGDKTTRKETVLRLMNLVGLREDQYDRYAHEFSGGQRQRIGIARALALNPSLIIADEPVSALDVSIQAQVLNLLQDLQENFGLTYLFISHDLSVVRHISNRVAVMYLGKLVEIADTNTLFAAPVHPYTKMLMEAIPLPDPTIKQTLSGLTGEVPSPINPPSGCRFSPRCPYATDICREVEPLLIKINKNQQAACHLAQLLE